MPELSKYAIIYMPEEQQPPLGIVQILHGMADYQGRYREFAQFLTGQGYAVVTSDLRGHGNHISRNTDLGFFGDNAVSRLIGDVHEISQYIREQFPGIPHILIGQGMGALLAVTYFKKYDSSLDGLFLMGMPSFRPLLPLGNLLVRLFEMMKGEYYRSRLIQFVMLGQYYQPFRKEGSNHAWLSSDPEAVSRYDQDPKCGFLFPLNGFQTLVELMAAAFIKGSWIRKKLKCPIRLLWGADDPSIRNSFGSQKTVQLFSDQGYTNIAYISYPGQRHEVLQDTRKETAFQDILRELESICKTVPDSKEEPSSGPAHIVLDDFIDPEVEQPLQEEAHIDLEEFINSQKTGYAADHAKVEMIDFLEIDQMAEQKEATEEQVLNELLSGLLDAKESEHSFYVGDIMEEEPQDGELSEDDLLK